MISTWSLNHLAGKSRLKLIKMRKSKGDFFVESPGYPSHYPNFMDCYFWVPIHHGKALKIVFYVFNLVSHSSCR